ncbi:hypothetical protein FB446DRAFT_728909 [Lentinula raphanica]|nr:hypothetical protein FB446DRAFT_728909 [Lentinula raphanica]
MTRPTASQTVAIFILGTAISSGILAAPTLYAKSFDPTSTQPSDGLDSLSKGQLREFATAQHDGVVYANVVPRQNGESLTPDDDSKYGKDGNDSNVSVNLEQRGNLSKRGGGGSKQDSVENENSPLLSDQRAEERTTKELKKLRQKQREEEQKREELIEKLLKENGKNKLSLLRMETEWSASKSDPANPDTYLDANFRKISRVENIKENQKKLRKLLDSLNQARSEDSELQELRTRAITLWRQYKGFMEGEVCIESRWLIVLWLLIVFSLFFSYKAGKSWNFLPSTPKSMGRGIEEAQRKRSKRGPS